MDARAPWSTQRHLNPCSMVFQSCLGMSSDTRTHNHKGKQRGNNRRAEVISCPDDSNAGAGLGTTAVDHTSSHPHTESLVLFGSRLPSRQAVSAEPRGLIQVTRLRCVLTLTSRNVTVINIHVALDVCQETSHVLSGFRQRLASLNSLKIEHLSMLLTVRNV